MSTNEFSNSQNPMNPVDYKPVKKRRVKKGRKKVWIISSLVIVLILAIAATIYYFVASSAEEDKALDNTFTELAKINENVSYDDETGLAYINNEIIVMASEEAGTDEIKKIADKYDAEISDAMEDIGFYCFTFNERMTVEDIDRIVKKLSKNEMIDSAYLNPVVAVEDDTLESDEEPQKSSDVKASSDSDSEEAVTIAQGTAFYPDDDWNGATWNVNIPRDENWGVEAINAPFAWAHMDKLEEVNIGLIDTMPDLSHSELEDTTAFLTMTDPETNKYSTIEVDNTQISKSDHGTHVAGIMGAKWNGGGISGVTGNNGNIYYSCAYDLDLSGRLTGEYYSAYNYVKAIKVLINNDVSVINISLNTSREACYGASKGNENAINYIDRQAKIASSMLGRIIDDIQKNNAQDFVICVAAGNTNGYDYYPTEAARFGYIKADKNTPPWVKTERGGALAEYNNFLSFISDEKVKGRIITVGSIGIDHADSTGEMTDYKYSYFSCVGDRIDVVAPGEDIYSCIPDSYASMDGTSMATPHVSGVAGLAFAANPSLSGPDVKALVTELTSEEFYYAGGNSGLVDADLVIRAALQSKEANINKIVKGTGSGIDLCFVVDTTGSMSDDIGNAKENMVSILSELEAKSADYRVALVDYRDFESRSGSGDYPAKIQLEFSSNNDEIIAAINSLDLGYGGDDPETVYSGINETLKLDWRARAQKIIIILGDAPPHDPEPDTDYTYEDVLTSLYNADIGIDLGNSDERVLGAPEDSKMAVYSIGIGGGLDFFEEIAEATGGKYTEIADADQVSDAIIDSIRDIKVDSVTYALDFGKSFSDETVKFYKDDEYVFELPLDNKGQYQINDVTAGEYRWTIDRLQRSGTISFDEDEDNAQIKKDSTKWYNFAIVLWKRHRTETILWTALVLVLLVVIIIAISKLKKYLKKAKARRVLRMEHCPACNNPLSHGKCKVCGYGSNPLTAEISRVETVFGKEERCNVCNALLESDSAFCINCGAKIAGVCVDEDKPAPQPEIDNNIEKAEDMTAAADQAEQRGVFCNECGTPLNPESDFCPNCGVKKCEPPKEMKPDLDLPRGRFCNECGTMIKEDNIFCPNCGRILK